MQDDRLYDEKELEKSWLISYSDLFTLLFVIILIIAAASSAQIESRLEEAKQAEAAQRESAEAAARTRDLLELQKEQLQREIAELEARRHVLKAQISPMPLLEEDGTVRRMEIVKTQLAAALAEFNISFEETPEGIMIRFPEQVLFDSGSAEVRTDGKQAISAVARVLQRFPHRVRIEGYTDDVPITSGRYASNWELSSARAISVMREMVDGHGLPPSRFMIAGWGEHNPVAPNDTPEHRALNRRVEVVILADTDVP